MGDIRDLLKEIPPAPEDTEQWLRSEIFTGRYVIYDPKTRLGSCTFCGHAEEIPIGVKHNHTGYCPRCGNNVIFKSKNVGRKKLEERARVLILGKRGKSVYAVLSKVILDYSQSEWPTIFRTIEAVYKFNKKEQRSYAEFDSWYKGEYWEERKRFTIPYRNGRWSYYFADVIAYRKNLNKVFRGTDLKYCEIDQLAPELTPNGLLKAMYYNAKYDSVEKIFKLGLAQIILDRINENYTAAINWRGKDIRKILGLNRAEIREAVSLNIGCAGLMAYKRLRKSGAKVSMAEVQAIGVNDSLELARMECKDIQKLIKYLASQKANAYYSVKRDYMDYIEQCKQLGFDLDDKRIRYPKNLKKAHDEASILVKVKANEKQDEAVRKVYEKLKHLEYYSGSLFIRPARNAEEIIREGKKQQHCVGMYVDRVAKGSTAILLIRKADKPNESYYTMEWHDGKVLQCRGKCNGPMTKEVEQFVKAWKEWQASKNKKQKRTTQPAPLAVAV